MKKRVLKPILSLMVAAALMSSCSQDLLTESPLPVSDTERIDLAIDGALSELIHFEQSDGLIFTYENQVPLYNENEHIIRLVLDETSTLELTLFNVNVDNPLTDALRYSAYPEADMEDKNVYVIANFVAGEGDILYSTTQGGVPPLIQPNVFEIREADEGGFNARIHGLELFSTDTPAGSSSIKITGTFISKN